MSITQETRKAAHESMIPEKANRRDMVLDVLRASGPSTAEEIAERLYREGKIPYANRTFTAPRLTELKKAGMVEAVGKRESPISGLKIAVWQATV